MNGAPKPGVPNGAKPETPAAPQTYKIKVDGQEVEMTQADLERYASKGKFADKAIQQARELAKAAQQRQQEYDARESQRREAAKKDPDAWLKEHGIDTEEYARTKLERRVAEGKMTPEERRAADAEARAKSLEEQLAARAAKEEAEQSKQFESKLERDIQGSLMGAVKRAGMETSPDTLFALHEAMEDMNRLRLLPTEGGLPPHIADRIVEDAQARIDEQRGRLEKAMLGGLKGAALKARLGDAVYKEVLAHALEEVRSRRPGYVAPVAGVPKPAPPSPVQKPSGYKKISDFDDAVHKMAERHTS